MNPELTNLKMLAIFSSNWLLLIVSYTCNILPLVTSYLVHMTRSSEGELVRHLCSVAQTVLVFHMGTRILRVVLSYEN